jgi:hypothetical protein
MKLSLLLLVLLIVSLPLCAQTAALRGQVMDETGAVVPGATVALNGPSGAAKTATSGNDGSYSFIGLPPGSYTVRVSAPDLTQAQPVKSFCSPARSPLNVKMKVASVTQQVTVQDTAGPSVSTDPSSNSTATVLRGDDLQALSDDPDDLQSDLQALAGPSAGPEGGEIYIDGFSGGQLPSKDSIREVRINQNPFSPEFSKLGYGRIEILTKPGTDKLHGQGFFNFGDDIFNSRNPYAQQKAPFRLQEYGGTISGPLSKRASFFLDTERRAIDNGSVIDAITLDPQTLRDQSLHGRAAGAAAAPAHQPARRLSTEPEQHFDRPLRLHAQRRAGSGHRRLQPAFARLLHAGSGPHGPDHRNGSAWPSTVNETRFQFYHTWRTTRSSNSLAPAILVLGSFNTGGAQTGPQSRHRELLRVAELHSPSSRARTPGSSACARAARRTTTPRR